MVTKLIISTNGIDVGDNFFSRPDVSGAGRLYVGVFASATPSIITVKEIY